MSVPGFGVSTVFTNQPSIRTKAKSSVEFRKPLESNKEIEIDTKDVKEWNQNLPQKSILKRTTRFKVTSVDSIPRNVNFDDTIHVKYF